jgi:predicted nucleic acid-binding protein
VILDTSFLIDLLRRDEAAQETMRALERAGEPIKIPAMTILELFVGVAQSNATREEERAVRRVLSDYPRVDMDETIARRAGRMIGALNPELPAEKGDAAVAATADVADETVLTRNTVDFERLGVDVETY